MQAVHAMRQRARSLRFDLVVAGLGLAVIGLLAWWTGQPLLFPSLGPSLMLVADSPSQPTTRTWNIIVGHTVGLLVGLFAIVVTGLQGAPPVTEAGTSGARVLATALALALTTAILHLIDRRHPPAGATTLIVALGLLDSPHELAAMFVSFLLLAGVCALLQRVRPVIA
jgi:CBS domain-containing membrane protein